MPIGNFYLGFHLFCEGIDYVLGHSVPKNEELPTTHVELPDTEMQ